MASAAMECFERHAGERTEFERFTCSYDELPADRRIAEADLPLSRNSIFTPKPPQQWAWADDLLGGGDSVAVPTVMVGLERHKHPRSSPLPFHFSSNGLNSGNTASEALIGGLYEVIERDATTCTKYSWRYGAPMHRVDLSTATSPDVAALVETVHAAGVEVVVIDCTVDTGVPTFCAYLCDLRNPRSASTTATAPTSTRRSRSSGRSARPHQGRLVFIAGSRDDSFRHHRQLHSVYTDAHELLLNQPFDVDLADYPDQSGDTFEDDGRTLLGKLADVGISQVLAVELTHPDTGVDVYRVIVPGLEGYMLEDFSAGRRARRWGELQAPPPSPRLPPLPPPRM